MIGRRMQCMQHHGSVAPEPCHAAGGRLGTRAEMERLQGILAGFSTSAEEDAALLAGGRSSLLSCWLP